MSRKPQEDVIEEVEEVVEKESVVKRKKAKKKDAIERFSGLIFLFLVILVGLLLWVGGEVGSTPAGMQVPTAPRDDYSSVPKSATPRVIVE
jgi:cytoskeletal protein RodZ